MTWHKNCVKNKSQFLARSWHTLGKILLGFFTRTCQEKFLARSCQDLGKKIFLQDLGRYFAKINSCQESCKDLGKNSNEEFLAIQLLFNCSSCNVMFVRDLPSNILVKILPKILAKILDENLAKILAKNSCQDSLQESLQEFWPRSYHRFLPRFLPR